MLVATKLYVTGIKKKKKKQIASPSIQTAQNPAAQTIVWEKKAKGQKKKG